MSFLLNLLTPAPPPPPPVPALLPGIAAPTAAQIAESSQPNPAALQLLTPQQTPPQYLAALQEKQQGDEMVKTIAFGLPDREGVTWAVQSGEKVSGQLPESEVVALRAAQVWTQDPTPANQAAAAAAAAKTDFQGPGAWAAQAVAWSAPALPGAPRLTPLAVTAGVLLASAILAYPKFATPKPPAPPAVPPPPEVPTLNLPPQPAMAAAPPPPPIPPKVQAQTFRAQQPFIAMGLALASRRA